MSIDSHCLTRIRRWNGRLAGSVLAVTGAAAFCQVPPAPTLQIDFDRLDRGELAQGVTVHSQFPAPDAVPGVSGLAWRTDGFSTDAEAAFVADAHTGFALALWVALESYPSDLEVSVSRLTPSSIAQQAVQDAGFDLFIDAFGRWGLRWADADGQHILHVPARFPLQRWTHVGVNVDVAAGRATLYLDGMAAASLEVRTGASLKLANAPLMLASPPVAARILDFQVNRLNAAYDSVVAYRAPLPAARWSELSALPPGAARDAATSLAVPPSRFAADFQRPRVHPMPPANWTNEPHGLVRVGDTWHLFYQRTPNGPFKTLMHWGHMASRDLVRWEHLPDALWPELQGDNAGFDMKGIWSGSVIADEGKAFAFYTSVNHGDRLGGANPGIAMAVSEDPSLVTWRKLGPILNSRGLKDFRDPFLWKEAGTWHMVIGAAREDGGGLEYLALRHGEKGARWERQPRFVEPAYRFLDMGSEIWEMPVFAPLGGGVWILAVNPVGGRVSKYGEPATRAVYWTGTWSEGLFKPFFRTPKNLDLVPGHLAPTVAAADDGQLRAIGIIDERRTPKAQKRAGWAHTFSLPRAWRLMADGQTLGQAPAPELTALRGAPLELPAAMTIGAQPSLLSSDERSLELELEMDHGTAPRSAVVIDVLAAADGRERTRLIFDPVDQTVTVDKTRSSLAGQDEGPQMLRADYDTSAFGPMRTVRLFIDGSAIDAFVNDAAAYAVRSYPSLPGSTQVRVSASGQPVAAKVRLWPLHSPTTTRRQDP